MRPSSLRRASTAAVAAVCLAMPVGVARATATPTTTRVSISSTGTQADRPNRAPAISGDARWIAFVSDSSLMAPGDTNNTGDVFVHDRSLATTQRVSVNSSGVESRFTDPTKAPNASPAISEDGRYVAFSSGAWNLATGDTNELADIFVRDRTLNTTVRASVSSAGAQGNGHSTRPAISPDGRYVAFESSASNLVPGDTNGTADVFVRDLLEAKTSRVSVRWDGVEVPKGGYGIPAISRDGRYVAFHSLDRLHPYDQNGIVDVYVRDTTLPSTDISAIKAASLDTSGRFAEGNPWDDVTTTDPVIDISADGRYVVFESGTPTLVNGDTNAARDVFLRDTIAGSTERVSLTELSRQISGASRTPSLSDDGRYASFVTDAAGVVAGDTNAAADVFRRNRSTGATERTSLSQGGSEADGASDASSLSADGATVVFASLARNLVPADTNAVPDIFVRGAPIPKPPAVPAIVSPASGATVHAPAVTFQGTAEAGTQVRVFEGASTLASTTTTSDGSWSATSISELADGQHSVFAVATRDGMDSPATAIRSFWVDTSGPTVSPPTILRPTAESSIGQTDVEVSGSADPNVPVSIVEGSATLATVAAGPTGSWSVRLSFAEGAHTIAALATDPSGNQASSGPRTFTVDLTAPAVPTITEPAYGGTVYTTTVTARGTAEPRALVYVFWENTSTTALAGADGKWSRVITVGEGENEIVVRARDAAGNLSDFGDPHAFVWKPDRIAPTIQFSTLDAMIYAPGTPALIEGVAQDNYGVERIEVIVRTLQNAEVQRPVVTCSGCGTTSATWSTSPLLPPGVYRVVAFAYDVAGGRSAQDTITIVRG